MKFYLCEMLETIKATLSNVASTNQEKLFFYTAIANNSYKYSTYLSKSRS